MSVNVTKVQGERLHTAILHFDISHRPVSHTDQPTTPLVEVEQCSTTPLGSGWYSTIELRGHRA